MKVETELNISHETLICGNDHDLTLVWHVNNFFKIEKLKIIKKIKKTTKWHMTIIVYLMLTI